MAAVRRTKSESDHLTAGGIWKGENESDAEQVEDLETNPLADAGVWTDEEAYKIYREKLSRLRDLYMGQLGHLKHVLQEKRREFLLQWQCEGGSRPQASLPSQGGSRDDAAYRCYRKHSGEEALIKRKQKQRRLAVSQDYFINREGRQLNNKAHIHYLMKLHHQFGVNIQPQCQNPSCEHHCMPFASRCSRHICEDEKQMMYTRCSYVYPSGNQCSNPIARYLDPPLCGGHCDNVDPPKLEPAASTDSGSNGNKPQVDTHEELQVSLAIGQLGTNSLVQNSNSSKSLQSRTDT